MERAREERRDSDGRGNSTEQEQRERQTEEQRQSRLARKSTAHVTLIFKKTDML